MKTNLFRSVEKIHRVMIFLSNQGYSRLSISQGAIVMRIAMYHIEGRPQIHSHELYDKLEVEMRHVLHRRALHNTTSRMIDVGLLTKDPNEPKLVSVEPTLFAKLRTIIEDREVPV